MRDGETINERFMRTREQLYSVISDGISNGRDGDLARRALDELIRIIRDEAELERLRYQLRIIADMASESRPLVNEVCQAIRLIDQDAAAANVRGAFLAIEQKARGVIERSIREQYHNHATEKELA